MNIEEMAKKVSPVTLALLAAKADRISRDYNRDPSVDQGGQYVFTNPERILQDLLENEIKPHP